MLSLKVRLTAVNTWNTYLLKKNRLDTQFLFRQSYFHDCLVLNLTFPIVYYSSISFGYVSNYERVLDKR